MYSVIPRSQLPLHTHTHLTPTPPTPAWTDDKLASPNAALYAIICPAPVVLRRQAGYKELQRGYQAAWFTGDTCAEEYK